MIGWTNICIYVTVVLTIHAVVTSSNCQFMSMARPCLYYTICKYLQKSFPEAQSYTKFVACSKPQYNEVPVMPQNLSVQKKCTCLYNERQKQLNGADWSGWSGWSCRVRLHAKAVIVRLNLLAELRTEISVINASQLPSTWFKHKLYSLNTNIIGSY